MARIWPFAGNWLYNLKIGSECIHFVVFDWAGFIRFHVYSWFVRRPYFPFKFSSAVLFENSLISLKSGQPCQHARCWSVGPQRAGLQFGAASVTPVRENGNWGDTDRSSFRTSVRNSLQLSVSPTNCPIITINGIWQSHKMCSPIMIVSGKLKWCNTWFRPF